jgi:prepilin-type N-terminal cleavage/methylation domain-containing protein
MKTAQHKVITKGFTLIELLVVITIIAALAVTVFVALNPAGRLSNARDARRTADVDSILTAIHEYTVDNKGTLPTGLSAGMVETELGTGTSTVCGGVSTGGCTTAAATACVDLTTPLNKYLKAMPIDPKGTPTWAAGNTGYDVLVDTNGLVTVRACGTEGTNNIYSSR